MYSDQQLYVQVSKEPNNLRQGKTENVSQFHRRTEQYQARILTSNNQSGYDGRLFPGYIININYVALIIILLSQSSDSIQLFAAVTI